MLSQRSFILINTFIFITLSLVSCKNINKEQSHLHLYKRLRLIEFRETLLPFKLTTHKKLKVGDSIRLDRISYKIVKIIPKDEENRHGESIIKRDKSIFVIKSKDGKYTIRMQLGKPVYSPKPKAVIEDLVTGKIYHVGQDDTIKMYLHSKARISKKTGKCLKRKMLKYKVISVDRCKKQVIVEYKNKKFVICN